MVSIIENWTEVEGVVLATNSSTITISLSAIKNYHPYPNLLQGKAGDTVTINIPPLTNVGPVNIGGHIKARVRVAASGNLFFHPTELNIL